MFARCSLLFVKFQIIPNSIFWILFQERNQFSLCFPFTSLQYPLTPKSDWHQISPHSITPWITFYSHASREMITNWRNSDCETNSPCQYCRKSMEKSVENMHICVGVWRILKTIVTLYKLFSWVLNEKLKEWRNLASSANRFCFEFGNFAGIFSFICFFSCVLNELIVIIFLFKNNYVSRKHKW